MRAADAWNSEYMKKGRLWRGAGALPDVKPGSKVLELGCGDGKTAAALSKMNIELCAVDCSGEAVRLCREAISSAGGKADVRVMDGRKLGFHDMSFDDVICFHYLAHMKADERRAAADEAVRVLRKGGRLHLRDFGRGDVRYGKGSSAGEEHTFIRGTGILTHYFSESEVVSLFTGMMVMRSVKETKESPKSNLTREEIVVTLIKQ